MLIWSNQKHSAHVSTKLTASHWSLTESSWRLIFCWIRKFVHSSDHFSSYWHPGVIRCVSCWYSYLSERFRVRVQVSFDWASPSRTDLCLIRTYSRESVIHCRSRVDLSPLTWKLLNHWYWMLSDFIISLFSAKCFPCASSGPLPTDFQTTALERIFSWNNFDMKQFIHLGTRLSY